MRGSKGTVLGGYFIFANRVAMENWKTFQFRETNF